MSCDWPSQHDVQLDCMRNMMDTDCTVIQRTIKNSSVQLLEQFTELKNANNSP